MSNDKTKLETENTDAGISAGGLLGDVHTVIQFYRSSCGNEEITEHYFPSEEAARAYGEGNVAGIDWEHEYPSGTDYIYFRPGLSITPRYGGELLA